MDLPVIPGPGEPNADLFIQRVNASGRKWVILTDPEDNPRLVLDADSYLRAVLADSGTVDAYEHCHRLM